MTAIETKPLATDICCGNDCKNFMANLAYVVDPTAKTVKITNGSTLEVGDTFKKVLVNVYDQNGKTVSGVITITETDTTIALADLNTYDLTITATVVTAKGCKANVSIKNAGGTNLEGVMIN